MRPGRVKERGRLASASDGRPGPPADLSRAGAASRRSHPFGGCRLGARSVTLWDLGRAAPFPAGAFSERPPVTSVLIVDDDPDICDVIAHMLGRAGFEVRWATDGERGLRAALRTPPDLVLLDWTLPSLPGPAVCRKLRENPATATTPIIMVTGRGHPDDVRQSLAAGADDHLVKPFAGRELMRRVRGLVGPDR
jgi:CheY-like chemotaxis protein